MHGHEYSWHYPGGLTRNLKTLLQSEYIKEEKYGGYVCYYNTEATIETKHKRMIEMYKYFFHDTTISVIPPTEWLYPCCGTFFFHSNSVYLRPLEDYQEWFKRIQSWSHNAVENKTYASKDPAIWCGRVFEGMWHVIFSNKSVTRPPPWCGKFEKNIPLPQDNE